MDDEWAKGVMDGFDTMAALREQVETDLRTQAESRASVDYEEALLDALEQQAKAEFAPMMVETEIDHMLQEQDERMRQIGVSLADYAARTGQEPTELRESMREQAEKRVVRSLIISELTEQAGIEASADDVEEEITRLMEAQGEDEAARKSAEELFSQDAAKDTVRRRLVARKSVDYLTAIAKGENPPDPAPAKAAEPALSGEEPEPEETDETETQ
jgi:trigger factor